MNTHLFRVAISGLPVDTERMTTKITRDVLENHLRCKYKGYLKLFGQRGSKSDYEVMLGQWREQIKFNAVEKLLALPKHGETIRRCFDRFYFKPEGGVDS